MCLKCTNNALWPASVWAGDVIYPPGGVLGPRVQSTLELVLLHTGEMTVWVDDVRRYAPAGTVSLLFPGHVEQFAFAEHTETRHSFIHIEIPDLPAALHTRLTALPWQLPLSPKMNDLIHEALVLRHSPLSTADDLLKTVAVQMLLRYLGEAERDRLGTAADILHPAVERAQQYVQTHLHEPITLDTMADSAAVSPAHLIRLFQTQLRITPIAYVWQERVALGIELLENTGLAVGTIAERCGFQTSYHFSRRVRQSTGLSPLDVRRRAWGR